MASAQNLVINPGWQVALGVGSFTDFTLNGTTDGAQWCFQADEAVTITRLGFRYALRTGTPPTFKISLQGVSATTGLPDGTIKGGGSPASATFTPPADTTWNNTWQWITLANSYVCTRGEYLAIVIAYDSGTIDGSNNSQFTVTDFPSQYGVAWGFPYGITVETGTPTRSAQRPQYGYGSATRVFGNPGQASYGISLHSGTTPDEAAARLVLPSAWGSSFQIKGVSFGVGAPITKTVKIQVYEGTTVLQTTTWDTDRSQDTAFRVHRVLFQEGALATLRYGTVYRVGFQPQEGATGFDLIGATQASNAEWEPFPLGIHWYVSTRTDAGAWTDVVASRLSMELMIADLSGLVRHGAGMSGGMRG